MSKRAVKPAKRADDRRRAGAGDNVAFTVRPGAGGLGAGRRVTSIVAPALAQHQFTNRADRLSKSSKNGKGTKKI
jgi:hypothetical protein